MLLASERVRILTTVGGETSARARAFERPDSALYVRCVRAAFIGIFELNLISLLVESAIAGYCTPALYRARLGDNDDSKKFFQPFPLLCRHSAY